MTVYDATERWLRAEPMRTFRVADDGTVVGTISLESASHTTAGRPVRDAMMPLSDRTSVGADESLGDAFEWVAGHESRVDDTVGTVGVIRHRRHRSLAQGALVDGHLRRPAGRGRAPAAPRPLTVRRRRRCHHRGVACVR